MTAMPAMTIAASAKAANSLSRRDATCIEQASHTGATHASAPGYLQQTGRFRIHGKRYSRPRSSPIAKSIRGRGRPCGRRENGRRDPGYQYILFDGLPRLISYQALWFLGILRRSRPRARPQRDASQ